MLTYSAFEKHASLGSKRQIILIIALSFAGILRVKEQYFIIFKYLRRQNSISHRSEHGK